MSIKKSFLLLFLIFALVVSITTVQAEQTVLNRYELGKYESNGLDYTKPGGIVIGPAMPRAFFYGGRHSARTSDGILHVSWENPTYDFPFYAHSLDALGLAWTEPMNIPATAGFDNLDRCLMAKLSVDPTNDDIYLLPAPRVVGGVWRTQLTRSTDGGDTWCPFMDLGNKIGVPVAEVSWATMALGTDRVLHITYARNNQDMFYTRTDLSAADGQADLSNLVFTKANGDPGQEAISFVPSGVVFQGTIVLDRNNDPHIIFSGDGGSDTFGDKTPYHIYYKTAAAAWGPIPPTRLQAELEECWGMPEMVFDQNNRGFYFMDNSPGDFDFGTWEPPVDPNSATDFGTLNNGLGFEGAVSLNVETFSSIVVTDDDDLMLPNADIDDENDVLYLVGNTNSYDNAMGSGGDIVVLKIDNVSTLTGTDPAGMPWELHRWITRDGISPLGDVGADVVYDPASTTLDIFWSGAGAGDNNAQYFDGTSIQPNVDAKPQILDIGIDNVEPKPFHKGDEIVIKGVVKNNGKNALGPVPVTVDVLDSNNNVLWTKSMSTPPLLKDQVTSEMIFGSWVVEGEKQNYSVVISTNYAGDEATYNDVVGAGFYAYPDPDDAIASQDFQDYLNIDADGDHVGFEFPTWTPKQTINQDLDIGGWTVVDSSDGEEFDYYNGWLLSDDDVANEIGAYLRHMNGTRNDTTFGDMPTGTPPQPQNELLFSPVWDIPAGDNNLFIEFTTNIGGTDGEENYPIYASVDMTVDGGATWLPVVSWMKENPGPADYIDLDKAFYSYDITAEAGAAANVQFRYWWKNPNNDGSFATWFVDNVYLIRRDAGTAVGQEVAVANQFNLSQNYPNPFNPATEISFTVEQTGKADLVIFNVTGQEVARLVHGIVTAGTHKVRFDASHLPTGVYFYKLTTENKVDVKKMALIK